VSRLLIVGAGGHGAVVAEAAAESSHWDKIQFLDDKLVGSQVLGFSVVATTGDMVDQLDDSTELIVALGNNVHRLELLNAASKSGAGLATVIHPAAQISRSALTGGGCAVFAGVVVNARAKIGLGAILNTGATVDHDCVIGDGVHISPGANLAGEVTVGDRSWIGIGASVREGVTIGCDSIVAAGAAVIADVADGTTVGGVPARVLKTSDDG